MIETISYRKDEEASSSEDEPPSICMSAKNAQVLLSNHEYQLVYLCAPACARISFKTAIDFQEEPTIAKILKKSIPSQVDIAKTIFSGHPTAPEYVQTAVRFIPNRYFNDYQELLQHDDCLPEDLSAYIGKGAYLEKNMGLKSLKDCLRVSPVITLWSPPMPDRFDWRACSHYSIIARNRNGKFQMVETSTEERRFDARGTVIANKNDDFHFDWTTKSSYWIDEKVFYENWHDEYTSQVAIVLDLLTIRPPETSAISQPVATL